MTNRDERRRQIERLLGYPGVGLLAAPAIAKNLGASPEEIRPVLDALAAEGGVVRTGDGRFTRPAGERGGRQ